MLPKNVTGTPSVRVTLLMKIKLLSHHGSPKEVLFFTSTRLHRSPCLFGLYFSHDIGGRTDAEHLAPPHAAPARWANDALASKRPDTAYRPLGVMTEERSICEAFARARSTCVRQTLIGCRTARVQQSSDGF